MVSIGLVFFAVCVVIITYLFSKQLRDIEERVGKIEEQLKEKVKQ